VYEKNGSGFFPIEEKRVFTADAGVSHTGFFADTSARGQILDWERLSPPTYRITA
jgi:hypothetical protein